jgi:hypothetical protein
MTDHEPRSTHLATPEFRASLEEDVVREFHRESRLAAHATRPADRRLRTAFALAAGLLLGVGGQFATGQVQKAREKSELEVIINTKRELAGVRLELARSDFELAKKRFDTGVISRPSLLAVESDLRSAESVAARLNLDLQEVRATAGVPRDELWAPLVDGRDFVKERLNVVAAAVQQRIRSLESAAEEAERGFRVGSVAQLARGEAVSVLEQARGDMNLLAQELMLRRQFFEEQLSPEELTRRFQRLELVGQLQRSETQLRLAQERVALAEKSHVAGTASDIELMRARLDVMERNLERVQLARQLQQLEVREKKP